MVVGAEQRVQPASFEQAPGRRLYWLTVWRRWLALRFGPVAPHGVLLVALYAMFALLARLISFGRVQRSTALVVIVVLVAALFVVMVGLFVRALWAALRGTCGRELPGSLRPILAATLGAGLCLVTLPRLFSKDVLSYLVYGRAFGAYGLNPYTTNPINMQYDFNFRLIDWHDAVSVYGPVWTLLCTALYKVVHPFATTHVWGYVVGFRLLALAFHLGSVVLVWQILGRLRPREQVAGTIFYAWNPLTLIEFAGNGHNDAALVFFLLAALAAHTAERRRPALVELCLALSVLTKFITLLIVPAYALLLWRSAPDLRARLIAWGKAVGIGLAACVLLWAPFAAALRHPGFLVTSSAASAYDNSLLELVYWSLRHLFAAVLPAARSDELENTIVKTLGRLAFVVIWGVLTWRARSTARFIHASFWILFAYLVLATPWFWPWYVTWLVALAPLTSERRATAATLTFSASVLVLYVLWGNQLPYDRGSMYPIHNIVAFGLPLLVLWLQLRRGGAENEPVYAGGADLAHARLPASS
ncbi:MAG: hypothetical protein ACTHMJ_04555 [Thermomicrobiales bacterium]